MASTDIRFEMITLLPRLRRFAYSLARSVEDADDLVQSTCERALNSADSWLPGTRLDSWMFRIMRNLWIDRLRHRRVEGTVVPFDRELDVPGDDGHRLVEGRLELAAVQSAVMALPEEQRSVLVLVCVEDLGYREAAAVLDVPVGTVMSRLARARQKIADAVSGGCPASSEQRTGVSS